MCSGLRGDETLSSQICDSNRNSSSRKGSARPVVHMVARVDLRLTAFRCSAISGRRPWNNGTFVADPLKRRNFIVLYTSCSTCVDMYGLS